MGRFLFVVPPIVGHVLPTLPVGRELMDRGHEVIWAGHHEFVGEHLPDWAAFRVLEETVPPDVREAMRPASGKVKSGGLAAFIGVWKDFVVPVTEQMVPALHRAVDDLRPDAIVTDQQTLAGAIVAEVRGIPWGTSATTGVELVAYAGESMSEQTTQYLDPATMTYLLKLGDWLKTLLHKLVVEQGVDPVRAETFNPRFSPHEVVAFTTQEMLGFDFDFPGHFTLVGPSMGGRPNVIDFPWDWIDGRRPLLLVSLGTINFQGNGRFFQKVADAVAPMDVQAVIIAPDGVDFEPPPNVLVCELVPQLELLQKVDAVVTHGGQGTVSETLAVGRPMVVAPIRDDQPLIAAQVERIGAGVTVRYSRVTVEQMRGAIDTVLNDKAYRTAAERVQASFTAAGGPKLAADRFERLLDVPRRPDAEAG